MLMLTEYEFNAINQKEKKGSYEIRDVKEFNKASFLILS